MKFGKNTANFEYRLRQLDKRIHHAEMAVIYIDHLLEGLPQTDLGMRADASRALMASKKDQMAHLKTLRVKRVRIEIEGKEAELKRLEEGK